MKNIIKKIMIYAMVGMMQVGLGATVVAASPLHNDGPQRIVQLDDRHDDGPEQGRPDQRRHKSKPHQPQPGPDVPGGPGDPERNH
jgi:hypothetical protein